MTSWFLRSTSILLREMLMKFRLDLAFQIVSHKIMRWFTPYYFILLFISNSFLTNDGLFYRILLTAQSAFYLIGIIGLYAADIKKIKPPLLLKVGHYFLMYNYAFLVGTLKGMFSKSSSFWEKVR
jgi:hypothetical protein